MIKIIVSILAVALGADGGAPDAEIDLALRGIHYVHTALSCRGGFDGGTCEDPLHLDEGWWMTRERMAATGVRIVTLENDLASEKQRSTLLQQELSMQPWVRAAMIGFGIGVISGAAAVVYLKSH